MPFSPHVGARGAHVSAPESADRTREQGFPRSARLLKQKEFKNVFADPARIHDRHFTILYRPGPAGQARPRLGLAVSKRRVPKATARNRVKRAVRESFRLTAAQLGHLDIVVLPKDSVRNLPNAVLRRSLDDLWQRLKTRTGSH